MDHCEESGPGPGHTIHCTCQVQPSIARLHPLLHRLHCTLHPLQRFTIAPPKDPVARNLMPQQPHIRIALCQEGRTNTTSLYWEGEYFKALFSGRYGVPGHYLGGPHVTVECYEFRFDDARNLQQDRLPTTDIFYMTGFTGTMAPALRRVMQEHCARGEHADDEGCPWDLEQRSVEQQLYSQIKARVQYNKMVYMGTCGGACCFGRDYWSGWRFLSGLTLFDFCMGVSLRYDSGSPAGLCDQSHISSRIFMITSGAGLAVHIENHE